jgi:hypothetical protein
MEQTVQKAIIADLSPGVASYGGQLSRIVKLIGRNRNAEVLGQDWIARRLITTGLSGSMRVGRALRGPVDTTATSLAKQFDVSTASTYPGHRESTHNAYHKIELRLSLATGNLHLPVDLARAEKLDAFRVEMIAEMIRGHAKKIAHRRVKSFFKQDGVSVVGICGTVGTGPAVGVGTLTFGLEDSAPEMYQPGEFYEIFNEAGTVRRHSDGTPLSGAGTKWCMCDSYDPLGKTVTFKLSTGDWDTAPIAGDVIIDYNDPAYSGTDITSAANAPEDAAGFFSWTKASGNIFDRSGVAPFDLNVHTYLRSLVKDFVAEFGGKVPVTGQLLTRYCGALEEAYPDVKLTHILMRRGVYNAMVASSEGQIIFDAQGQTFAPQLGFKSQGGEGDDGDFYLPFNSGGRLYRITTERYMPPETVAILNLSPGNVTEVFPPELEYSRRDANYSSEIEFVGTEFGSTSIWMPTYIGGELSNVKNCPWEYLRAVACRDPRGGLLTSVQELSA